MQLVRFRLGDDTPPRIGLHADEPEDRFREHATDYKGRAIPVGEGVQWFKGRIHPDCLEALNAERKP